jgi:Co/Zn/Cd efflux system component
MGQRRFSLQSLPFTAMSDPNPAVLHRHGRHVHGHPHTRPHRHLRLPRRSQPLREHGHGHRHDHHHHAGHDHSEHGHSHGLLDRSIVRSREGVKAVSISLAVLGLTAGAQAAIFLVTGSVALLADLIHNIGDALTAVPLGIAFFFRSFRAEKLAGLAVVLAIFISACVALYETIQRLIHPQQLSHLWALAFAGLIGFAGNEIAAQVRLRAGRRLSSPALVADGNHARVDGFVSLGVVGSAVLVALGAQVGDPLVGLAITLMILKITWDSWRLVSTIEPGSLGPD